MLQYSTVHNLFEKQDYIMFFFILGLLWFTALT